MRSGRAAVRRSGSVFRPWLSRKIRACSQAPRRSGGRCRLRRRRNRFGGPRGCGGEEVDGQSRLRAEFRLPAIANCQRRGDEPVEQRMGSLRAGLELRVELRCDEPRMVLELDDLDEATVRALAAKQHACRLERLAVAVVYFEAVAVALVDDLGAVHRGRLRARGQSGRIQAETHRPALVLELALIRHEVDDGVLGEHVELCRVGVLRAGHLAGELDDGALETEAQAEIRDLVVAGEMGGEDLAFDAAMTEATRYED